MSYFLFQWLHNFHTYQVADDENFPNQEIAPLAEFSDPATPPIYFSFPTNPDGEMIAKYVYDDVESCDSFQLTIRANPPPGQSLLYSLMILSFSCLLQHLFIAFFRGICLLHWGLDTRPSCYQSWRSQRNLHPCKPTISRHLLAKKRLPLVFWSI